MKPLAEKIHKIAREKGFWDQERNVGELLMLVVSELGEALEAHRQGRKADILGYKVSIEELEKKGFWDNAEEEIGGEEWKRQFFEAYIKDSFGDEIADTIIRLLDLSEGLGIDIEWHIKEKIKYNKTREKLHGKKY